MTLYIGLDVHGKETVYAVQDRSGNVVGQGKVPTTVEGFCQLVETLETPKGTKIGLETGTRAMWVSRLLSGLEMEPVMIDAREVRQKARRIGQKSDRRDAFEEFETGYAVASTPRLCTCRSRRYCDCGRFSRGVATS